MGKLEQREIEVMKQVPKGELLEFVEKNGQRMRSILEEDEERSAREVLEELAKDYSGL